MSLTIVSPNTVYLGSAEAPSGGQPIIINLTYMQDTAPSNPQEKDVWYNTSNDELYTYKNGQWIESDPIVGVWYKFGNQYYLWDGNSLEVTDLNIYEKIENKVTSFSSSSTDIEYPSAKAVYTAFNGLATVATSGSYEDLSNKPSINGVTLSGNKTSDDLGLNVTATINFYDVNNWTLDVTKTQLTVTGTLGNSVFVFKNGQLIQGGSGNDYTYTVSGSNSIITFTTALEDTDKVAVINGNLTGIDLTPYAVKAELSNVATSGSYGDLSSLPQINGVTLSGNKTSTDLGLVAEEITRDTATVSLDILANKVYKLTNSNITSISFASCEKSELVTKIDFTTGATAPQFTDTSGIDWADGETPVFQSYQHYWIIISDKVGFVKEIY